MVQDSYVLAHSWRRYTGDGSFVGVQDIDNEDDNGKIWSFQDYTEQDFGLHSLADLPNQKNESTGGYKRTIGYQSAQRATEYIMRIYLKAKNKICDRAGGGTMPDSDWDILRMELIKIMRDHLCENVYGLCHNRNRQPSGESHPLFSKGRSFSDTKKKLFEFCINFESAENSYINSNLKLD